jgi:quercetin dioxygenase-like cupin family protein
MAKIRIERWKEVYTPNAAVLRMKLSAEGYRVTQWSDRAGLVYALHKHPQAQSHWVISGSMEFTVGGETYVLNAGDRDFLEADTWHKARVVSEENVVYLIGEKIK